MQNSKLYSILENFNKYEQNRLKKYILSPYFNRNETLVQIFEILTSSINGKIEKTPEKAEIWSLIYPETPYDDVLFRKHCSDLLKLIEGFFAQQVYEENPIDQTSYLIEAVGRKKLQPLFNSTMRTARRLSEQQVIRNSGFYLSQYQIERNYYELLELIQDRTQKRNLENILENLDLFYLAEKLRYYCTVLSRKTMVAEEYKLLFIDEILNLLKKYQFEDVPPIAVYYHIYLTHEEFENTDYYYKLMELLAQHGDLFPKNEAEFIYTHALNYCVKKLNQGSQQFLEEYFNVFVILLQKELLLVDGELSPYHFRNIVSIALRLGKFDWTENFIKEYQSVLPEPTRDNAVSFNLALLYFYKKEYEKVIELLQSIDYEDFIYNLNSKSMLLQTYYEIDEIEPLYSLMDSFRTYLNRHKEISASRRVLYTNLIKFTKQLTKIMPGDKKALDKLKKEIEVSEPKGIASITWLKEKIEELE